MATRKPTIADAALELIRARGPLTLDELAPLIVAAGRTAAKDPRRAVTRALTATTAFVEDVDGRWYSLADQLEGAVFAVRPLELERRDEIVLLRSDLVLLDRLLTMTRWTHAEDVPHLDFFGDYFELPSWHDDVVDVDEDGRPVFDTELSLRERIGEETAGDLLQFIEELGLRRGPDDEANLRELLYATRMSSVIHGPLGWMPPVGPRDLLGLRVEDGVVHAVALDRRSVTGVHVEAAAIRMVRMAQRVIGPDPSWFGPPVVDLEELLTMVITEAPELLRRPLPPLVEVIRRGGLAVDGGLVGHPGTFEEEVLDQITDRGAAWGFDPPDAVH